MIRLKSTLNSTVLPHHDQVLVCSRQKFKKGFSREHANLPIVSILTGL